MWSVFNPCLLVQSDFLSWFSSLVQFISVTNTFEYPFYILLFDRHYSTKLNGAEIADDEDIEGGEAFEVIVEVSGSNYQTLCHDVVDCFL